MGNEQSSGLSKQEMSRLKKNVNMPVEEIQQWYKDFKRNSRNGRYLSKDKFREVYKKIFGSGAKDFADNMFRTFDRDGSGSVDFEEFLMGIYMTSSNDVGLKLKWAFNMYDMDGSGSIDRQELYAIIKCAYKMNGEDREYSAEELSAELFREMDADGNGEISWEEFHEAALRDRRILELLQME